MYGTFIFVHQLVMFGDQLNSLLSDLFRENYTLLQPIMLTGTWYGTKSRNEVVRHRHPRLLHLHQQRYLISGTFVCYYGSYFLIVIGVDSTVSSHQYDILQQQLAGVCADIDT